MKKTVIGSGQYNLDTIVVRDYAKGQYKIPFRKRLALQEVGGTCGNVMCILAWMGWDARPLACLDDSPEGMKVAEDLQRYGCDCRYVTNRTDGGTTLLQCTHNRYADGTRRMSVRAGAPGGSRFPKRRYLRARDEAPAFLAGLEGTPAVFFFDDPSAGNRALARGLRERGSLVYFEPSRIASNADLEAVGLSDIIKFSDENVPDVSFADAYADRLFIQTLGAKGVRFKFKAQPWRTIDAREYGYIPAEVVDTEGAGDWFTATLLNGLADQQMKSMESLSSADVWNACRRAMIWASHSVTHLGSLGLIRALQTKEIVGAEECPWCEVILDDAWKMLPDEDRFGMGTKLFVVDWDLDRVVLLTRQEEDPDAGIEYTVRTWNISEDGVIDWTLFRMVDDGDGEMHGEELCSGTTDYPGFVTSE